MEVVFQTGLESNEKKGAQTVVQVYAGDEILPKLCGD